MEYKIFTIAQYTYLPELEKAINIIAKQGWEYVTNIGGCWYLFKKEDKK